MLKKCKLVMLPSNEKANRVGNILFNTEKNTLHLGLEDSNSGIVALTICNDITEWNGKLNPQHLYITSDDEIKQGDWCIDMEEYNSDRNNLEDCFVYQSEGNGQDHWNNKKILVTTDSSLKLPKPSQSFIQKYIEEYNKGQQISDILVEYEEYAVEAFKETIKKGMFNGKQGLQLDTEIQRVIGNISHSIVMEEVQKYIPNCEQLIKDKTLQVLKKDSFSYEVFKKRDVWDKEESLAVTYMKETIRENKELFQKRIKETVENYDLSNDIAEQISNEFGQMADTIYKLSELFQSKKL